MKTLTYVLIALALTLGAFESRAQQAFKACRVHLSNQIDDMEALHRMQAAGASVLGSVPVIEAAGATLYVGQIWQQLEGAKYKKVNPSKFKGDVILRMELREGKDIVGTPTLVKHLRAFKITADCNSYVPGRTDPEFCEVLEIPQIMKKIDKICTL